jgi:ERCC4-type nuclease
MPQLVIAKGENSLCAELLARSIPYRVETLPVADVVIRRDGAGPDAPPLVLIERKTVNDLMASIRDGRYKEQAHRLAETGRLVWWIIEGQQSRYRADPKDKDRLCAAIASLGLLRGFTPVRTTNTTETAILLQKLLAKANDIPEPTAMAEADMQEGGEGDDVPAGEYSHPHKRFKSDCITRDNIQTMMLAQIPNVSVTRARAILEEISLADIMNGKSIPRTIRCSSNIGSAPRKIPTNVLAAIEDYLHPR